MLEVDGNGRIIRPEGFDANVCILDLDSPSYGNTDEELIQCGCNECLEELNMRIANRLTPWAV